MGQHPMIGKPAPGLTLPDANGNEYTLPIRQKPIALFFYPKAGTKGCTTEACSFRDAQTENVVFKEYPELEVVGISTDSVARQAAFAKEHSLTYTLLSDTADTGRKAYQVNKQLLGFVPGRETFFIDSKGVIRGVCNSAIIASSHTAFIEKMLKETSGGKA